MVKNKIWSHYWHTISCEGASLKDSPTNICDRCLIDNSRFYRKSKLASSIKTRSDQLSDTNTTSDCQLSIISTERKHKMYYTLHPLAQSRQLQCQKLSHRVQQPVHPMPGHLPKLKQKKSRTRTQCVGTITSRTRKPELSRAGRSTARLARTDTFPLCLNRRVCLHACCSLAQHPVVMLAGARRECWEFQQ